MKIKLNKPCYYFNDPIYLTPVRREITVNLLELEDAIVKQLNLGIVTGIITITEGKDKFEERYKAITTKPTKEVPVEVVEEIQKQEVVLETKPTETEKEEEVKDEAKKVQAPAKKTTRKTATVADK